jgi:hypothetical protein
VLSEVYILTLTKTKELGSHTIFIYIFRTCSVKHFYLDNLHDRESAIRRPYMHYVAFLVSGHFRFRGNIAHLHALSTAYNVLCAHYDSNIRDGVKTVPVIFYFPSRSLLYMYKGTGPQPKRRFYCRADSLKDDRSFPRRSKPVSDKRDMGQTNEQQCHVKE